MGRRGPKSEPAAIKEAKGNPGHRPIGSDPKPDQGASVAAKKVERPKWLTGPARKIWEAMTPRLIAMKLLGEADAEPFARYCRNYARWLEMQRALDKEGTYYESESQHGKLKRAHPAFMIADRLDRQLAATEARFGLNPADRQALYAARAANPVGDLLDRAAATEPDTPAPKKPANTAAPTGFLQ